MGRKDSACKTFWRMYKLSHEKGARLPMNKRIIILGGDGFCGWPTSICLSKNGYDVTIVDNLSRGNNVGRVPEEGNSTAAGI